MEWTVNSLFKEHITKIDHTLIPPGFEGDIRTVRMMQDSLGRLIDTLGEQSATAQGISKPITTAEKLQKSPTHIVYMLKDSAAKNGAGEIIGYLKVAPKSLYLFDEKDKAWQVEPLCVLDFYVIGGRQRSGHGKRLFDYMLEDTASRPENLAVDGPSPKMETFLVKHYGLGRLIRQSNNFAVAPAFFVTSQENKSGRATPVAPTAAIGRFAARKPPSAISDIIHGTGQNKLYVETRSGMTTPDGQRSRSPSPMPTPERYATPVSPTAPLSPAPAPPPAPASPLASVPQTPASASSNRPTTLDVAPAGSDAPSPAGMSATRRDSQLTDKGYFDIKNYHSKLW